MVNDDFHEAVDPDKAVENSSSEVRLIELFEMPEITYKPGKEPHSFGTPDDLSGTSIAKDGLRTFEALSWMKVVTSN